MDTEAGSDSLSDLDKIGHRAIKIHGEAGGFLKDDSLPKEVRLAARVAQTLAYHVAYCLNRGQSLDAATTLASAESALGSAQAWRYFWELWPDAKRGQAFRESCKKYRSDPLAHLIEAAISVAPDASAKALIRRVEEIDGGATIQEITDDLTIWWRGSKGERSTTFKAFQNRLSLRRKKIANA